MPLPRLGVSQGGVFFFFSVLFFRLTDGGDGGIVVMVGVVEGAVVSGRSGNITVRGSGVVLMEVTVMVAGAKNRCFACVKS